MRSEKTVSNIRVRVTMNSRRFTHQDVFDFLSRTTKKGAYCIRRLGTLPVQYSVDDVVVGSPQPAGSQGNFFKLKTGLGYRYLP
jgi:hypothetical protein